VLAKGLGTLDGLKLTLTYEETGITGEGSFTLAPDGLSFAGQWRERGTLQWQPWSGRRITAEASETTGDFSGVWRTSFGLMRLIQKGTAVTGCYTFGGQSEITGTTKAGVLQFSYTEPTGDKGTAEFKLAEDGATFIGTWKVTNRKQGGAWEGTRVKPMAGRTWLVVLEAHWESSLQQPEYSYGDMLRQFFTRVPGVAVRHRYFDGRDDFSKWCAELPYLNEPAVFYVSSHGTEAGITVGTQVLSGEFIGGQLRYAPEVKLVHLGACLAISGPVPH